MRQTDRQTDSDRKRQRHTMKEPIDENIENIRRLVPSKTVLLRYVVGNCNQSSGELETFDAYRIQEMNNGQRR